MSLDDPRSNKSKVDSKNLKVSHPAGDFLRRQLKEHVFYDRLSCLNFTESLRYGKCGNIIFLIAKIHPTKDDAPSTVRLTVAPSLSLFSTD